MCDYMCMSLSCSDSAKLKPNGLMVDGKQFVRLVSFDPFLRTTFDTAKHEKKPVNMSISALHQLVTMWLAVVMVTHIVVAVSKEDRDGG